jgi:CubicO group peptidase (beta-lactamase class C family)
VSRAQLASLLFSLAATSAAAQAPFPGETWPTATPSAVGINSAVLDSLDQEIRGGRYGNVDRLLVIRHGQLAWDRSYAHDYDAIYGDSARVRNPLNPHDVGSPYNYFSPWWHPYYRRGSLHTLQSVTKTITSVIVGVAVTRGDFPSIDTSILTWFDTAHIAHIDARKRRLTVRHLLSMTAGIDWNENLPYIDPRNSAVQMEASYDWVSYVINQPMSDEPGTVFNYNSGATELVAHIFRAATGTDLEEYAARHLFAPLGIRNWYWKRTPAGVVDTEGGLYLDATDLARVWYLFLQQGRWQGKTIVSPQWVTESVAPRVPVGPSPTGPRYGLAWWLYRNPRDSTDFVWGGSGFGGQFPVAFPENDLLIVINGWNILRGGNSLPLGATLRRLQGAATD